MPAIAETLKIAPLCSARPMLLKRFPPSVFAVRRDLRVLQYPKSQNTHANHDGRLRFHKKYQKSSVLKKCTPSRCETHLREEREPGGCQSRQVAGNGGGRVRDLTSRVLLRSFPDRRQCCRVGSIVAVELLRNFLDRRHCCRVACVYRGRPGGGP